MGEKVFLRISSTKGVLRCGKKGKLSPRYIEPYEILASIGAVAYKLALPPSLVGVHDVFHVLMQRKYIPDPTHVLTHGPPELSADLTYVEEPVKILERNHSKKEASWERESEVRAKHPHLFNMSGQS
ncbi:uncharacterized protein LOC122644757 [Telopea speciosissima]|uniref:uncharacterized protein LOC122644757 n=1 Tax=Telopea speciosissima TaxID=54955 RepID=UPI001CC78129|nr:uncharacterized protein LOC122644757 [Telopea speciosissima]